MNGALPLKEISKSCILYYRIGLPVTDRITCHHHLQIVYKTAKIIIVDITAPIMSLPLGTVGKYTHTVPDTDDHDQIFDGLTVLI